LLKKIIFSLKIKSYF